MVGDEIINDVTNITGPPIPKRSCPSQNTNQNINQNLCSKLIQMIFEDKYACMADDTIKTEIFKSIELKSLMLSLVSTDIQLGKDYDMSVYSTILFNLIQLNVLNSKSWKRTDREIKLLFEYSPKFALHLVENKIMAFSEIINSVGEKEISRLLSLVCVCSINGIKNFNNFNIIADIYTTNVTNTNAEKTYPLYEIQLMLTYNIPLILSDCTFKDIRTIIRNYPENEIFSINYLLANILKNTVSIEIFNNNSTKTIIDEFFSSDEFFKDFYKLNETTIMAYAENMANNLTDPNNSDSWSKYEVFLEYSIAKYTYVNQMFSSKFITLLLVIQDQIIYDEYHMSMCKQYYSTLLKFSDSKEIKKLKFNTILTLDFEISEFFDNDIFEILYETGFRDGLDLKNLRDFTHKKNNKIGHILVSVLKKLLFEPTTKNKKNINLLFFLLDKVYFSEEEFLNLKTYFAEFEKDDVLLLKLTYFDSKLLKKVLKVFPNSLKTAFIINFDKFNENIACVKDYDSNSSLENDLVVLNTLQKINNCNKFVCAICSVNFIECNYSCGHTICTECKNRSTKKCPFCNLESEAKILFFS